MMKLLCLPQRQSVLLPSETLQLRLRSFFFIFQMTKPLLVPLYAWSSQFFDYSICHALLFEKPSNLWKDDKLKPERHTRHHERKERNSKTNWVLHVGTERLFSHWYHDSSEHQGTRSIFQTPFVAFFYLLAFHQMWLQFFPFDAVPEDHLISIKMLYNTLKTDNLHHMVSVLCPLRSLSSLKLDSLSIYYNVNNLLRLWQSSILPRSLSAAELYQWVSNWNKY